MASYYATISEAWGDLGTSNKKKSKKNNKDPACSLFKQTQSEDDFPYEHYERVYKQPLTQGDTSQSITPSSYQIEQESPVTGIDDPLGLSAAEYDAYYKNDLVNMEQENVIHSPEEEAFNVEMENPIYHYPVHMEQQPYVHHSTMQVAGEANPWLELALYVFSGIILIFILEQVLQLGIHLR